MTIKTARIIGCLYALLGSTMALPQQYRAVSFGASLALLMVLTLIVLTDNRWKLINRIFLPIILYSSLLVLQTSVSGLINEASIKPLTMQFFYFSNVFLLIISARYFHLGTILHGYAVMSLLIFCLLFPLELWGVQILKNKNAVAFSLCPYLIYMWHIKPHRGSRLYDWLWTLTAIIASHFLDARLAMVIFMLTPLTALFSPRNKKNKMVGTILVGGAVLLNLHYMFNFHPVMNEVLTNRILLWNYYGDLTREHILFGSGPLSAEVANGAGAYLQTYLERGVASHYGTQSMYTLYYYQSGLIGLFLSLSLFLYALIQSISLFWPLVLMLLAGMLETISFGAVSIIGTPLTLFTIFGVIERRKMQIRPSYGHQPTT